MRALALVGFLLASAASAQVTPPLNSRPAGPTPKVEAIPPARDVPYPGTMQLTVDASDTTRGIFRIKQRIPVATAGDFVLLYPKWIPGGHSPRGDIKNVSGIRFSANGQPLRWNCLLYTSPSPRDS